ncbi:MAG: hypothetical protein IJ737_06980 [Ruminococcus sp.]|nr:hypothetical protein [Ruminococcus sp.]
MDLKELETRAKNGEDFPRGLTYAEHTLFGNFRVLYFLLRNKQCSVEDAKKEKQLYLKEYRLMTKLMAQMEDEYEKKRVVYDIINQYGGKEKLPPKVLEKLFRLLDDCLYIDREAVQMMEDSAKYLGMEWEGFDGL